MTTVGRHWLSSAAIAVPLMVSATAAAADPASFKGQTVTYIVATAPGGGYDLYGRLVAEFMERALPGSTFVVKNVPGAGHIIGANTINASAPDGLTIGTFNTGVIYGQIIGLKGIQFDLRTMSWIGKAASDQRVIVIGADSPIKSFEDLRRSSEVNFSTSGVGSAAYVETRVLVDLMNLPIKIITGYSGTDDQMAMRRGEITGTIASRTSNEQFVKNGYGRFIAQIGGKDKDVPQLAQFADSAETKALISLFQSQAEIARLTAGPPGISADRLTTLRTAYNHAVGNKEFRDKAAKAGRSVSPATGEEVEQMVKQALHQPPRIVAALKEAMSAKAETIKASGVLVDVQDKGRSVVLKGANNEKIGFEPSGSRTKVTLGGKDAKRSDLKTGLSCEVTYHKGGKEPSAVAC